MALRVHTAGKARIHILRVTGRALNQLTAEASIPHKPVMHIAHSPYFPKHLFISPLISPKFINFSLYFPKNLKISKFPMFSFNLHLSGSPYFDYDAFAHDALHVGGGLLDDPE